MIFVLSPALISGVTFKSSGNILFLIPLDALGYTNEDLKLSLCVPVHINLILSKFCILSPKNSRVIYP